MDGAPGAVRLRSAADAASRRRLPVPARDSRDPGPLRRAGRAPDRPAGGGGSDPGEVAAADVALDRAGDARGFRCATPRDPERRGGTAAADFPNALEVSRELNARDVVVDYRPGVGIRLSPHFYTEDAELDRAFETIDDIRASGAWKRWETSRALVT